MADVVRSEAQPDDPMGRDGPSLPSVGQSPPKPPFPPALTRDPAASETVSYPIDPDAGPRDASLDEFSTAGLAVLTTGVSVTGGRP
ncbi:MAG: hypothetical protein IAG13_06260, partial [Deltaproteobacteria bacterium]|nr:hypothetical protein [Nannocystaceae bacterium]